MRQRYRIISTRHLAVVVNRRTQLVGVIHRATEGSARITIQRQHTLARVDRVAAIKGLNLRQRERGATNHYFLDAVRRRHRERPRGLLGIRTRIRSVRVQTRFIDRAVRTARSRRLHRRIIIRTVHGDRQLRLAAVPVRILHRVPQLKGRMVGRRQRLGIRIRIVQRVAPGPVSVLYQRAVRVQPVNRGRVVLARRRPAVKNLRRVRTGCVIRQYIARDKTRRILGHRLRPVVRRTWPVITEKQL